MKLISSISTWLAAILATSLQQPGVQGHGYIYDPPARNYVANTLGLDFGSEVGVPPKEYCPQCLNQNGGVCGITQDGTTDYDAWLDSTGQPMPFVSQRTYQAGEVISIHAILTANHAGHAELRGCPLDNEDATQSCLDGYLFEFVDDASFDMPKDLVYPERGYFFGGQGANGMEYTMKFRVPAGLVGTKVLLQWQYITANSCSPPGYANYFGGENSQNRVLPDSFWSPGIPECELPYPEDGSVSSKAPERFWNCAEVTIMDDAQPIDPAPEPILVPAPTPTVAPTLPPTTRPTSNLRPTVSPVAPAVKQCRNEWESCFDDPNSCCEENYCEEFEFYARCRRRPDACLLEWNPCNDDPSACCKGLTCKGDGWLMCQL